MLIKLGLCISFLVFLATLFIQKKNIKKGLIFKIISIVIDDLRPSFRQWLDAFLVEAHWLWGKKLSDIFSDTFDIWITFLLKEVLHGPKQMLVLKSQVWWVGWVG